MSTTVKRRLGHKVTPRRREDIHSRAQYIRDVLGVSKRYLKIAALYEVLQNEEILEFEIVDDNAFPEEAKTYPDKSEIKIKKSVYDKACDGDGHCRFTMAHELGHLFLHKNQKPVSYARGEAPSHKIYEDSEWQADEFASELLMDSRLVDRTINKSNASSMFGMSCEAANYKLHKMRNTLP